MSLPLPPPLPPVLPLPPKNSASKSSTIFSSSTASSTAIGQRELRVLSANDFKSYREHPYWMRAIEMMRGENITRSSFPSMAAFMEESMRRTSALMKSSNLPMPPTIRTSLPMPLPKPLAPSVLPLPKLRLPV